MENEFLQTGLIAIEQASKIILKYYQNLESSDVEMKKDDTPVTIADKKAEESIKKVILAKYPDHSLVGEEGSDIQNTSEYTWILDPIDGTRYFSRGLPYFTTELALLRNNEVIVGISHNHVTNQTLSAIKGQGAYLDFEHKLHVSNRDQLDETFASAGSIKYFDEINQVENLVRLNKDISQLRGLEESRMYLLLCQGTIDCILMAKGYAWDFAAASLILEESGAQVTTITGEKIDFYSKKSQSILSANPTLHPKILKYFLDTDTTTT